MFKYNSLYTQVRIVSQASAAYGKKKTCDLETIGGHMVNVRFHIVVLKADKYYSGENDRLKAFCCVQVQ